MATFTGTFRDDDFVATGEADRFRFGENEGVDLIVGFDVDADQIVYTDRSVDGFNDLQVGTVAIRGADSTIIESNDQFTVLFGVAATDLGPSNFVFTTGPNDGADFADTFSDLDDLDDDVSVPAVSARVAALAAGPDDGSGARVRIADGVFAEPFTIIDGQGDTEVVVRFFDAAGARIAGFFVARDSELNGSPVVTALGGDGRLAIAWEFADDDDPEDGQVLVQVLDFDGGSLTRVGPTQTIGGRNDRTDDPAIATLDDGTFVVVAERDARGEVTAQRFSDAGDRLGGEVAAGATDRSGEPSVRAVEGGYVVGFSGGDGAARSVAFSNDGAVRDDVPEPAPEPEPEPAPQPVPAPEPQPDPEPTPTPDPEPTPSPGVRPVLTDAVVGTAGDDPLQGGVGNEVVFGSDGDDRLFGGAGDDLLAGGRGRDRLTGGEGSDAFLVTPGSGRTVVTDFQAGEDVFVFLNTGAEAFDDLTIAANRRGDAVVRAGDERLVVRDVDADDLMAGDFIFTLEDWLV